MIKIYICFLLCVFFESSFSQSRRFYDNNDYKKQRHELNFGIGISNCLTDVGGSFSVNPQEGSPKQYDFLKSIYNTDITKSRPNFNASYTYHFKNRVNFKGSMIFATISGDDFLSENAPGRKKRNINFKSNILELSASTEIYLVKPTTGNKFNLKNVKGQKLASNRNSSLGIYVVGGIGGFFFNPKAKNNFNYENSHELNKNFTPSETNNNWVSLHKLHTEGQGSLEFENYMETNYPDLNFKSFGQDNNGKPKTYSRFAISFPIGLGLQKAFNGNIGIKIEASYRFTTTDYLDDVSGFYADRETLRNIQNILGGDANLAQTMSGTHSGETNLVLLYASNRSPGIDPTDSSGDPIPGANWYQGINDLSGAYGPLAYTIEQTSYEKGFQRGGNESNDSFMFINVSFYKKFSSHGKVYKSIHSKERRRIKASF